MAEERNLKEFLKILVNTNYSKRVLLKFFIIFFISNPSHPLNLFFIRQIILGKKLDEKIKSWVTNSAGYTAKSNTASIEQ